MSILLDVLRQQSKGNGQKSDVAAGPTSLAVSTDESKPASSVPSAAPSSPLMDDELAALKVEPPAFLDWRLQSKPDAQADTSDSLSSLGTDNSQKQAEQAEQPEAEPLAFTLEPPLSTSEDAEADLLFPEVTSDEALLPLSEAPTTPLDASKSAEVSMPLAMDAPAPISSAESNESPMLAPAPAPGSSSVSTNAPDVSTDDRSQLAATFLELAHTANIADAASAKASATDLSSGDSATVNPSQPQKAHTSEKSFEPLHSGKTHAIALPARPVMRKAMVLMIGLGLLFVMAFYGWLTWQMHEQQFTQDMASVQDPALSQQVDEQLARYDSASEHKPDAAATQTSDVTAQGEGTAMADAEVVQRPIKSARSSVKRASVAKANAGVNQVPIVTEPVQEQSGVYRSLPVSELLNEAYLAWQSGDLATAERSYRQILERQPTHRQALLGMLAVAQTQQNVAQVSALVDRLLQLYPSDADVQTAMLALQTTRYPGWESELKQIIARHPQNAQAHFLLGAFFASEKRWSEAQSAFFNAVSIDPQQPEYLANLAIALDQLGKGGLAATYYQQALDAAQRRPSHLNQEQIQRRLQYLLAQDGG